MITTLLSYLLFKNNVCKCVNDYLDNNELDNNKK